jgi:hypothetical protein
MSLSVLPSGRGYIFANISSIITFINCFTFIVLHDALRACRCKSSLFGWCNRRKKKLNTSEFAQDFSLIIKDALQTQTTN